jgi:hypothetical protein
MTDRPDPLSESPGERAFLERITPPLKTPETHQAGFEDRVMEAVRAEAPLRYPGARAPWWRRPRTLRLSPLAGLGLAAGFAGLVALGTLTTADRFGAKAERPASASVDTVHLVRFAISAPEARTVALVGDFNGWAKSGTELSASAVAGVWTITLPLPPGRHQYAFLVDGERWVIDPTAIIVNDDFGTETSVVTVNGAGES